ncbi:MAG: hypothetical protein ABIR66_10460 [Saprospiraceae bacterium]
MFILQIEHDVPNFEGWKKAFLSDPIDRKKSGVKEYRVYCPQGAFNYVIIDLVFEELSLAESTLEALHKLWGNVEGTVMANAKTRFLETVEI